MPRMTIDLCYGVDSSDVMQVLYENGYCDCQSCNALHHENDSRGVYVSTGRHRDMESWCDDCAENTFYCGDCHETFSDDCADGTNDDGETICIACAQEYVDCQDCGSRLHSNNAQSNDDGYYCDDCASHHSRGLSGYHSDSIRQSWGAIPRGAIAIEIECNAPSNSARDDIASELREKFCCAVERDGSLDDSKGMEIITKPDTIDKQRQVLAWICDYLKSQNVTAWNCGTGYGIHVNLDGRKLDAPTIAKFCNLFGARNMQFWESIAGRTENQWAKYKRNEDDSIPDCKYSAAALKPGGRIEVRVFRSTVNTVSALGYVAICADALRYAQYDLFGTPSGFLAWLDHNASKDTCELMRNRRMTLPKIASELLEFAE